MRAQLKFIFIETICTDPEVLHQNYLNKMKYSPDYKGVDMQQVRWRGQYRGREGGAVQGPGGWGSTGAGGWGSTGGGKEGQYRGREGGAVQGPGGWGTTMWYYSCWSGVAVQLPGRGQPLRVDRTAAGTWGSAAPCARGGTAAVAQW